MLHRISLKILKDIDGGTKFPKNRFIIKNFDDVKIIENKESETPIIELSEIKTSENSLDITKINQQRVSYVKPFIRGVIQFLL